MLIESIIRRKGGTFVKLGDVIHHFAPSSSDPRHLAETADPDHIQTFLAIKEGYRIAKEMFTKPWPEDDGTPATKPASQSKSGSQAVAKPSK